MGRPHEASHGVAFEFLQSTPIQPTRANAHHARQPASPRSRAPCIPCRRRHRHRDGRRAQGEPARPDGGRARPRARRSPASSRATASALRRCSCAASTSAPARRPRAILINTGNANAGTGADGLARARATCAALARLLGMRAEQVLPFSTGVIMETLPIERIEAGAAGGAGRRAAPTAGRDAAEAIMTTDTRAEGGVAPAADRRQARSP